MDEMADRAVSTPLRDRAVEIGEPNPISRVGVETSYIYEQFYMYVDGLCTMVFYVAAVLLLLSNRAVSVDAKAAHLSS